MVDHMDVANVRDSHWRGLRRAFESTKPVQTTIPFCQSDAVLATAVVEMTKALPEAERFRHLLRQVGELRKRFEDGYRLFAAGFSYEKLRDQVEAAYRRTTFLERRREWMQAWAQFIAGAAADNVVSLAGARTPKGDAATA